MLFGDVVVNIKYLDYITFQGICQYVARLCDEESDLPVMEIKRSFDIDSVGSRIASTINRRRENSYLLVILHLWVGYFKHLNTVCRKCKEHLV